ncbi:quinoprotein glucose dehydrogenase [Cyclobacterium xiamenense]|uniref:Quinoprotein glucose dehydrogenase n=1 Tax=Cyclobacterium xiamenense TaxID=1297121 RepID=A0A1H7A057_9BACT|nr:PQQ-binding-like beta-propeller repeat protein [Cyclobacterium xiamenense]SEJ55382.1 quinoprotein glucose dehydrogenase [Cyclobacterium xiamenense]
MAVCTTPSNPWLPVPLLALCVLGNFCCTPDLKNQDWPEYLGGPDRNHYSPLAQISPENVGDLQIAWSYSTGDSGHMQTNPLIVDGVLYGVSASLRPFALDAATGQEIWRHESAEKGAFSACRGLSYWKAGIDERILYTQGEWLHAVDARTGKPIPGFGTAGKVSLKTGLGPTARNKMVLSNTPGTVFENLIVMPLRVAEDHQAAAGHIQAFDVRTGALVWVFHTIPHPGEYGYETWPPDVYKNEGIGGANNWAGMAVDRERGILYVPTGSAAPDFYGGDRPGANLFANTLLALDARTGKRIWHYQLVHHDILDMDLPAPPNLITVRHAGKTIDAVAQVTKHGYVFLFDRETGLPLFDIEEVPVPASAIPGEQAWPTQPIPSRPAPFARQLLSDSLINPKANNRDELLEILRNSGYQGPFTPLNERGMLVFPGLSGGAIWGGAAADPEGILYINSNEMARYMGIGPSTAPEILDAMGSGERVYTLNCAPCHGTDRNGHPQSGYPSLRQVSERKTADEIADLLHAGKGMMPAFPGLAEEEKEALIKYLLTEARMSGASQEPGLIAEATGLQAPAWVVNRYMKFLDDQGYPAVRPPWGTLTAIDMNSGDFRWQVPFGENHAGTHGGDSAAGTESFGGPLVTGSGLLFIAATRDGKLRAYATNTGKLLWETLLPAAAFATPSSYSVNGKQYIVLACGGGRFNTPTGDQYVALALP